MKRRIIKQGHNTLTVTLPSKWVKKFDIKAGDELDIIEQGKDLLVSTEKTKDGGERAVIDVSGLMIQTIWRLVSSAYRAGYDEIKIIFEDNSLKEICTAFTYNTMQVLKDERKEELSTLEAIQSLVNRFVGFEIIEHKSNYCIIKDLGFTSAKEFDNTLRRIFLLLKTMSDATLTAMKAGSIEELKGIHIIDTNLDRFQDFCLRVLNKSGYKDFKKTPTMYTLIFLLELVGDEFKRLALHVLRMKKSNKDVIRFMEHACQMFRSFYELYYSFSKEGVEKIYKIDRADTEDFEKKRHKFNAEEAEIMHHIKKIDIYTISLVELRMDLAY